MNDKEEKDLINSTKKTIIGTVVSAVFTLAIGATVFYFNTTHVTAQNTSDIQDLTDEVRKISTVPALNQNKIKNIEKDVARIESNQNKHHKENKESIKEIRKEQQKILELLYQIKNQNNN